LVACGRRLNGYHHEIHRLNDFHQNGFHRLNGYD
jgi:hypothetical protein